MQRSPRITSEQMPVVNSVGVEDISCLVIPYGCLGLPTIAALYQGIPVIAVRENLNIMRNDLRALAWRDEQLITVENYWEAAGVIASLKIGLDPYAARRPIEEVNVTNNSKKVLDAEPVHGQDVSRLIMYLRRIHLNNICGIKDLNLGLTDDGLATSTLLIGKNGTGKSSVLRAIVLGLASETEATALLAEPFGSPFISVGQAQGTIELEIVNGNGEVYQECKQIAKHGEGDERVTSKASTPFFRRSPLVVAFGAGRSIEGPTSSGRTYRLVDSTYMLFNYEGTFIEPELTLRRLKDYIGKTKYNRVLSRIRQALGLDTTDVLEFERGGGVVVSGPYRENPVPLHSWADGYRVTLNWLLDIYAWAMTHKDAIDLEGHVRGFLIVDEIEQHLHPSMQRNIVQSLKKLFPKLQIMASTHSPLVLQGLHSHEIVSLQRNGSTITTTSLGDYSGYSVEDLLTAAELFETPPYSITVEDLRTKYRSLIAKSDLSGVEREQLRCLGRQLANMRLLSPLHIDDTLNQLKARLSELEHDSHQ